MSLANLVRTVLEWAGYAKKALAAASVALIVTGTALEDGVVTQVEIAAVLAAWAGVLAVFQFTNAKKPE